MKTLIDYRYSYFDIYHVWSRAGTVWEWSMQPDQCADATYYRGTLRTFAGHDPNVVGTVFKGFHNFRSHSEVYSRDNEWQHCITDTDSEWYCLHGRNCKLDTHFIRLEHGETLIPPGSSLVILEGSVLSAEFCAGPMVHIKPRDKGYIIKGSAIAFLIRKI